MNLRSFLAGAGLCCVLMFAARAQEKYPLEPPQEFGQGVTPAYEGYFPNPDGSLSLLWGYYNRNTKEVLDISIGPENRNEPGGPDRGQPTHFLTARQWGLFTVTVPKGFSDKLTWTLTANGKTSVVPANLDPLYLLSPLKDAINNTPPFVGFSEQGPFVQGPAGQTTSLKITMPDMAPINLWVADDAAVAPGQRRPLTMPVNLTLSKYRGPGAVKFSSEHPQLQKADFPTPGTSPLFTAKATASATFSEPGEYILRVVANDWSGAGGGGFQCCWTNAEIKVSV